MSLDPVDLRTDRTLGTTNVMAPFTPEQVSALTVWQNNWRVHPFTCANRGDGKHIHDTYELGTLVPTVRGWFCPYCDYTQNWAHAFMAGVTEVAPTRD